MKGPEAQCMGGGVGEQKDQFEKKMNKDTFFLQKQGLDILSKALEEKSISKKDILAHSVRTADTYYSMYEKAISTKEKDKIIENFETSQLQISGALEDIVFREESPEFRTEAMNTLISLFSQSITEKPFHNITFNDLVQRTIFTLYRANANDLLTDEINYDEFNDLIFRALDFQCSKTKSIVTTNDPVYNLEKTGQSAEDIRFSGFEYVYSKGMSFRSNESAKRLLKKMESAENDSEKQVISKILYQLEFGKIGISEQGVKYLEKMYDLGEMNNPDYFVNRLTGKGDIGVFDKNQVLQGYFNIGELTNEEEVIKPEVMEFTYETLFFSRESETEEERKEREQYLQEFKESYFEFYDDEFVEKTGARFNNLDFKEQGQFLVYYKNSNEEKREQLMSFIAEHKENGLKTFLSIEQGGQEMGEKILLIGESLKDESQVADELFAQYAVMIDEIQDSIEDIKKMYDDIFYDVQLNENELQNAILQRSMKLLMSVAENISKVEDKKQFIRDVIADLQREAGVKRKSIQSLRDMKEKINNMMEQGVLRALGGYGETYEEIQEMTDDVETLARLKKETRFDSKKLQTEIENLKKIQKEEYAYLDSRYEEFDRGESREQKINPDITREKFSEMIEHLRKMNPSDEEIEELEQLLQLQIEFERTFDNLVYEKNVENDNKSENVSAKVMQKYQELIEQAKKSKMELKILFSDNIDLNDENIDRISGNMLEKAQKLLDDYVNKVAMGEIINEEDMVDLIENMNTKVLLISEIVGQLSREDVSKLDLIDMPDIDKYVDFKKDELQKEKGLLMQMKHIVENQCPAGAADIFIQDCLSDKNAGLTVTIANEQVLSFFMKSNIGKNLVDLDWFTANPNAPIKGLGEATVVLGFNEQLEDKEYYAVAKPFVKSFLLLIERLKFVSFGGVTADGEYLHHYVRTRRLQSDLEYDSKNFTSKQEKYFINDIKERCVDNNDTVVMEFEQQKYHACKVIFANMDYTVDVTEDDADGWIYREIKNQSKQNRVLTRFIPDSNKSDNNIFYAVFEEDKSMPEEREEIEAYLTSSKLSHNDSNNKENN